MANEFYNHGAYPANAASGASAPMRSELDSITTGFAKLPTLTGNGNKAVVINSGGTGITVTTGALSLAGNLTMSGAFNTTFVAGATVELTLPTSAGTLALTSAAISNLSGGTAGDAIYQSAVDTTSYLAAGTVGQVYLSGGTGAPTWTTGQLSLAGNVSFTAANNIVFATVGAYTYTLPSSTGTLALTGAGGGNADNVAGGAAGDIVYQSSTDNTSFIGGSAGEALLSGGSGAPTFTTGTLALAGNFSTTGAYNLVLAQGASVTLTLPTSSDTLVGRASTDTLTNKTLTTPTISGTGFANANHAHSGSTSGGTIATTDLSGHTAAAHDALVSGVVVGSTASVTLTNKTLTAPIIGATEWTSANHTHAGASTGGTIAATALTGTLTVANGGTGATTLTGALVGNGTGVVTAGTLSVANGGTGATTLTNHGVMLGSTTAAVSVTAAGTSGQVLKSGGASADPDWGTIVDPMALDNFSITASVSSNILTIAAKGQDGNDPSSSNTVTVAMRHPTATNGGYNLRTITSALSQTLSSGSTIGAGNSESIRFYVYLVDSDGAGTMKLAITRQALWDYAALATTTSEGGSGGADSNILLYSAAAYSSKPVRLVAVGEITSAATAGQWDTVPTVLSVWTPGMRKTGDVVQTERTVDGVLATGTTIIPADDTIPTNTEGTEFITQAITPTNTVNTLEIIFDGSLALSTVNNNFSVALFQDSVTAAIATKHGGQNTANRGGMENLEHHMLAGTTSSTAFKIRVGATDGTTTFNGTAGLARYGGTIASFLQVTERYA